MKRGGISSCWSAEPEKQTNKLLLKLMQNSLEEKRTRGDALLLFLCKYRDQEQTLPHIKRLHPLLECGAILLVEIQHHFPETPIISTSHC
jgi:hypothetical protein